MERAYLQEDIQLIRTYFPGAKTVALRTPFDLTSPPQDPWKLRIDDCDNPIDNQWYRNLLWSR